MKTQDLLELYQKEPSIQLLEQYLQSSENAKIQVKGLQGSIDAIFVAALHKMQKHKNQLIILQDKEEAAYFYYDLQNLLSETKSVLLFPTSYKRPYHYEEIENANILQRTEVLNLISQQNKLNQTTNPKALLIVSYPEALSEKVLNKQSLVSHTISLKTGEEIDINTLTDKLIAYDFEKTDFVYEAGQFAIRGGIIDVFSFANEYPYRIELFGNEIETIRTFSPDTQLSIDFCPQILIAPNTQNKFIYESRESFLEFLPHHTNIWLKNTILSLEVIAKNFERVTQSFEQILEQSGQTQVISNPEILFETENSFKKSLLNFPCIEFGKSFYFKKAQEIHYPTQSQPSFNKDFQLLADTLYQYDFQHFTNIIFSDSLKQTERLRSIFEEIKPHLKVQYSPNSLREGFIDSHNHILCFTDHQIFERFFRYKLPTRFSKSKSLTIKELQALKPGDFVTHIDYGVGRFAGLEKREINGNTQEMLRIVYRDDDLLYVNIHSLHKISRFSASEGASPTISKLGSPEWENKKAKVKKKVKDIAKELISLYAKRKAVGGFAFAKDDFLQAELESSFIYEDTPDQAKATNEVKADMEQAHPMDRLVCGDVGFGKTEVAIRAAFKAVNNGKQVAVLVPTTILAMQHFRTFSERLAKLPCRVDYINRFRTSKEIKETLKSTLEGKVDILIGTHRILNEDVKFKDLGLMIIDEEQKFGVKAKERLKEIRLNVDSLTLTATPIPRTLHFSLMGARDLSIISTPPPNRQPVNTELRVFKEDFIRDAISAELRRGGQVFFVHNRVKDIESLGDMILKLVPDARIGVAHGQMEGTALEKTMMRFIEGEYDVLVSTNIIEAGLDIPNANTIIINHAHMFGLSDLHQMRGRVGRSNKKAFCYLLVPSMLSLTNDAQKRLKTLEEFSDLGDGFKVAMRDLDIRGAGDLLGAEQSGFINDLGFEAYHKILDETISELKETEFKDLFFKEINTKELLTDCIIETDLQMLIPDTYIQSITERLSLYNELDNIKEESEIEKFEQRLQDRFGKIPKEVGDLIQTVRLRWLAESIGFEKLSLKNNTLKGQFPNADKQSYFNSERFGKVLDFLQKHPKKVRLKEINQKQLMIIEDIKNVSEAIKLLSKIIG
ncbi:MAG: transcription-repair coupling factor [Thermonemataceae bacterium]|nr:transcription-repair coupling factor [Thermonemataceae bacterium]